MIIYIPFIVIKPHTTRCKSLAKQGCKSWGWRSSSYSRQTSARIGRLTCIWQSSVNANYAHQSSGIKKRSFYRGILHNTFLLSRSRYCFPATFVSTSELSLGKKTIFFKIIK